MNDPKSKCKGHTMFECTQCKKQIKEPAHYNCTGWYQNKIVPIVSSDVLSAVFNLQHDLHDKIFILIFLLIFLHEYFVHENFIVEKSSFIHLDEINHYSKNFLNMTKE
jgi:hypothetical protein